MSVDRSGFLESLVTHQTSFGLSLTDQQINRLADYYELVQEHNPLLHLVAQCSPEEFALRHILESLTLVDHLRQNTRFVDVGSGAGLPSIPCLLVRDDLAGRLIESKEKKTKFLSDAVVELALAERAEIVNRQFEETNAGGCAAVTCRALDKFQTKLPRLLKWSGERKILLFGGPAIVEVLERQSRFFSAELMPMSKQRYLFLLDRS